MAGEGWDNRPWAVGSLCKAFYKFGDGFIYRVTDISRFEPSMSTTLTIEPVFSAFANGTDKKHSKTRTLGSVLCTPLSLGDISNEVLRLETFIAEEKARGTQNDSQPEPIPLVASAPAARNKIAASTATKPAKKKPRTKK